ncbi:MAG TPA: acyl-CoA dehydrogenase family protein [Baekduia sp.]
MAVDVERDAAPGIDEMMERARTVAAELAGRARETEELRRVPDASIAALDEAGLFAMFSPPSVGGMGFGFHDFAQVVRVLAQGCASTAWVYGFLVGHNVAIVQNTPHLLGGAAFVAAGASAGVQGNPAVTARPVEGGWRVTGTWKFVSGIMNSEHVLLVTLQDNGDEDPSVLGLVADVSAGAVDDVWHFAGMKGTGSNTFRLDGAFVPSDREWGVWGLPELHPAVADSKMNVSIVRLFDVVLTAVAVGAAEAALEQFRARVLTRSIGYGQGPQREHREAWSRYADAVLRVRVTRLLWDDLVALADRAARSGEKNSVEEGALFRIGAPRVCTLARDALHVIADGSGSSVWHLDDPLQRQIRDVETLKSHSNLHWDAASVGAGSALLGVADPVDPLVVG